MSSKSPSPPQQSTQRSTSGLHDHDTVLDHIEKGSILSLYAMDQIMSDNPTLPTTQGTSHLFFTTPPDYSHPSLKDKLEPPTLPRTYDHYGIPREDLSYYKDIHTGVMFVVDDLNQCLLTDPVTPHMANKTPLFQSTREAEFEGLIQQGFFSLVHIDEAKGKHIFGSRFVDEIRHVGTPQAKSKSHLVTQAYDDEENGILTYAPTVLKSSQRQNPPCRSKI